MKSINEAISGLKDNSFDLNKSYDEALQNSEFKEFVSSLNIDRKILIKYTSLLENACSEYNNCKKCKSIFECKNKVEGFCYLPRLDDDNIIFEYKMCRYKKELDDKTAYKKNIYFEHVPEDIKNASMDSIYMNDKKRFEVIEYLHKFISDYKKGNKPKGLYLNGSFGCGKTYLVSAAFNELAKAGFKSAIVFWPEFLLELKSSFDDDFKELYDYIKCIPLLLIDDIGAENVTDWVRDDILCPLMQYRMENHLTTFFTSNLTLEELEEHYSVTKNKVDYLKSKRVIERIRQLTNDMTMISKNLRK